MVSYSSPPSIIIIIHQYSIPKEEEHCCVLMMDRLGMFSPSLHPRDGIDRWKDCGLFDWWLMAGWLMPIKLVIKSEGLWYSCCITLCPCCIQRRLSLPHLVFAVVNVFCCCPPRNNRAATLEIIAQWECHDPRNEGETTLQVTRCSASQRQQCLLWLAVCWQCTIHILRALLLLLLWVPLHRPNASDGYGRSTTRRTLPFLRSNKFCLLWRPSGPPRDRHNCHFTTVMRDLPIRLPQ